MIIAKTYLNSFFLTQAVNLQGEATLDIQMSGTSTPDVPLNLRLLNATMNTLKVAWTQGFDGGLSQTFQVHFFSCPWCYLSQFTGSQKVTVNHALSPETKYHANMHVSRFTVHVSCLTVAIRICLLWTSTIFFAPMSNYGGYLCISYCILWSMVRIHPFLNATYTNIRMYITEYICRDSVARNEK